jgi:hypothetical protein
MQSKMTGSVANKLQSLFGPTISVVDNCCCQLLLQIVAADCCCYKIVAANYWHQNCYCKVLLKLLIQRIFVANYCCQKLPLQIVTTNCGRCK